MIDQIAERGPETYRDEVEKAMAAEKEPTPYTKAEQQHYEKIRTTEVQVSALESKWLGLKERASDAKKAFEGAESELRATIREGVGQMALPGMEDVDQPLGKLTSVESKAEPASTPRDAWKLRPMLDVGITSAQVELFAKVKILNLGDFAKLGEKAGVDWYESVPGIGKGKAEKIDMLLMQFWVDNPQYSDDSEAVDNPPEAEEEKEAGTGTVDTPEENPLDEDPVYDPNDDDDDDPDDENDLFRDEDDETPG